MKTRIITLFIVSFFMLTSCSKDNDEQQIEENSTNEVKPMYFPPNATEWETIPMDELGWNESAKQPLLQFLEEKSTKGFIILENGRIAMEEYFGTFTKDSLWYWASAGKTLTSFTVGIAQEKGFLNVSDKSSDYMGVGWTSLDPEKEDLITIRHQLTMTTGLNGITGDCKTPECLFYVADAGTRWNYHNAPYTLLQKVVSEATDMNFSTFYNTELRNKIGMDGLWFSTNGSNNVYFSTVRSMARFGLLNLNNGKWDNETILGDETYLNDMKNTSQALNNSYGYLWWLSGKESFMVPASQTVANGSLIPNSPADMYSGLGKDDQKLYIVPSKNLVIVRLGEDAGQDLAGPSSFDNTLWEKINDLIN